jgi:putative flippase GtrA
LNREKLRSFIRYLIVGVANNAMGYLAYLLVTWLGMEPKLAVTLLYPLAALSAYFGHARYSFSYEGGMMGGLFRYGIAHVISYGNNILLLYVLHDQLHYPHQLVQVLAIFVGAGLLFLLFKFFVFTGKRPGGAKPC